MPLIVIEGRICCVDCDEVFDERLKLKEGGQCPNVSCRSNVDTAAGYVHAQIIKLTDLEPRNVPLIRALAGILPIRADSVDGENSTILNNLTNLRRVIEKIIASLEGRVWTSEMENIPKIRVLGHELDGVVIDVEQGDGFDEVCLGTIKRVRDALYRYGPATDSKLWGQNT